MTETTENPEIGAHVTPEMQQAFDDMTPLPRGARPEHPLVLEAREQALHWKWGLIQETLEKQEAAARVQYRTDGTWDENTCEEIDKDDHGVELATYQWLGSHAISPSSKVYTPFANGNLCKCPECGGTGNAPPETYTARDHLYIAEAERLPEMTFPGECTPEWLRYIERQNALLSYGLDHMCRLDNSWRLACSLCQGTGVHEPTLDAAWHAEMERLANERGLFFDCREDGDYQIGKTFRIERFSEIIIRYKVDGTSHEIRIKDDADDVVNARDILSELDDTLDGIDGIEAEVEHRSVEGYADEPSMQWFKASIPEEADSLSNIHSILDEVVNTLESGDNDLSAVEAYISLRGLKYLTPGDSISHTKMTRQEIIAWEIECLCRPGNVIGRIRHLFDEDALLAQAEQADDTVEHEGCYYVFDY